MLHNRSFRRGYVYTLGALVGVLALTSGYKYFGTSHSVDVDQAWSSTELSASRKVLSSGGEIIPGFNGFCPDLKAWENDSGAILHVILVTYLFLGIAIICDEQFTSSLECICDSRTGLGLSPDVAGATFMAAGSSAPELASSCMGTFVSKSDVGLGTIIGSAVFNILIIIGATAIIVGEPMALDWKPLSRDTFFYCGSVTLLIIFVAGDQQISPAEAGILLVYYGLYILFMVFNTGIMRWVAKAVGDDSNVANRGSLPGMSSGAFSHKPKDGAEAPADSAPEAPAGSGTGISMSQWGTGSGAGAEVDLPPAEGDLPPIAGAEAAMDLPGTPTMGTTTADAPPAAAPPPADLEKGTMDAGEAPKEEEKKEGGDEEEEEEPSTAELICDILSIPFICAFNSTMPDCKYEAPDNDGADEEIEKLTAEMESDPSKKDDNMAKIASLEEQKAIRDQIEEAEEAEEDDKVAELEKKLFAIYDKEEPLTQSQKLYLFTFFVSLVWITILSYFMVVLMEKIGCAWGISSFIMGITFLAMGTSVPDALGSIAVAREGEGDMAVSNAIGSNVFDICIGLGLPWFIATLLDGINRPILAATESIIASTVILFLVVIVLFTSLYCSTHPDTGKRFCLYPGVGAILFGAYFAFVVFQICWTAAGLPE